MSAQAVAALPARPIGAIPGVANQVLWQHGGSMAGVLRIEGGHRLGSHTHRVNHHHIWLLDGQVRILGQDLTPGAYVHIPAGIEHDLDATATDGCTVYYLYLGSG